MENFKAYITMFGFMAISRTFKSPDQKCYKKLICKDNYNTMYCKIYLLTFSYHFNTNLMLRVLVPQMIERHYGLFIM